MPFITIKDISKTFVDQENHIYVQALNKINMEIKRSEFVAIIGPSGAGKTTLLSIIGGLLRPSHGQVLIDEKNIYKFNSKELLNFRRNEIGFLWQLPEENLIFELTVLKNVMLPLQIANKPFQFQKKRALELLKLLGLEDRIKHRPNQISGGEAQRVGIAVALANDPKILVGDQITGELDATTSVEVVNHLKDINYNFGTTIIIATHKHEIMKITDRNFEIKDGSLTNIHVSNKNKSLAMNNNEQERLIR